MPWTIVNAPGVKVPEVDPLIKSIESSSGLKSVIISAVSKVNPPVPLGHIGEDFEVSPGLLDDFQAYVAQHRIQPSVGEWSADRKWIRGRLRQEIFNQAFGVTKGDEVEIENDPQVLRALEALQTNQRSADTP